MPVQHADNTGGRGPSPAIFDWAQRQELDYNEGVRLKTDFLSLSGLLTSTAGQYATDGAAFVSYQTGSTDTIKLVSTINSVVTSGGLLQMLTAATDDHQCSIELGDGNGGLFTPTVGAGNGRLAFECRFLLNDTTANLTTNAAGFYLGLGTPGKGTASLGQLTSGDALVTSNYGIQASILTGAPTTLAAGWINATGATAKGNLSTALAGYTFYKLGFLLEPAGTNVGFATDTLRWFLNGVEVTALRTSVSTIDANFPTGLALVPMFGMLTTGAHAAHLVLDWVQCFLEAGSP
jgi:hypothetical protein